MIRKFKFFAFALSKWLGVLLSNRKRNFRIATYKKTLTKMILWGKNRIEMRNALIITTECIQTKNKLQLLILNLKGKVVLIQTWLKKCLLYRKFMYRSILNHWNMSENQISLKKYKKKGKSNKINYKFLPNEEKLIYIKQYVKEKIKEHVRKIKDFKSQSLSIPQEQESYPKSLNLLSDQSLQEITDKIKKLATGARLDVRKSIRK